MPAPLRDRIDGRPVLVIEPDASSPGPLSVDLLATFNQARAERAAACVIPPETVTDSALLSLVPDDVPVLTPQSSVIARWRNAALARRRAEARGRTRSAFWREWHKEMRRYAGDERLPSALRARLRQRAQRAQDRSAPPARTIVSPRWLRQRVAVSLPPALFAQTSAAAAAAGIRPERPIVAIHAALRPDLLDTAVAWLEREGYQVARMPVSAETPQRPVDVFVLLAAAFVICDSPDMQQVAYLTNTPSLLLNARDGVSSYPLRGDCLMTLATPIDLDSGRELAIADLIADGSFTQQRGRGFRGNSAAQLLDAVREMHEGVTRGWDESGTQGRFRRHVAAAVGRAGDAGSADVPAGDGRLARWQAELVMGSDPGPARGLTPAEH